LETLKIQFQDGGQSADWRQKSSTAKFEFDQHLRTSSGCLVIFLFNLVFPLDLGQEVGSVRMSSTAQKRKIRVSSAGMVEQILDLEPDKSSVNGREHTDREKKFRMHRSIDVHSNNSRTRGGLTAPESSSSGHASAAVKFLPTVNLLCK
jgi:hypothetical protein